MVDAVGPDAIDAEADAGVLPVVLWIQCRPACTCQSTLQSMPNSLEKHVIDYLNHMVDELACELLAATDGVLYRKPTRGSVLSASETCMENNQQKSGKIIMKKTLSAVILGCATTFAALSTHAALELDQQNVLTTEPGPGNVLQSIGSGKGDPNHVPPVPKLATHPDAGQIFTVGKAGKLAQIDLQLLLAVDSQSELGTLKVQIVSVQNNTPNLGDVKAAFSLTAAQAFPNLTGDIHITTPLTVFSLGASEFDVNVGDVLAFYVFEEPNTGTFGADYFARATDADTYSGGTGFSTQFTAQSNLDLGFQTWVRTGDVVTVSEPGGVFFALLPAVLWMSRRGRRTKG